MIELFGQATSSQAMPVQLVAREQIPSEPQVPRVGPPHDSGRRGRGESWGDTLLTFSHEAALTDAFVHLQRIYAPRRRSC